MSYRIGIADSAETKLSWAGKIDGADGVVAVVRAITPEFRRKAAEHKEKLIIHIICPSDLAGIHPLCEQASGLVADGFPKQRVVIRMDIPLAPDDGINRAYSAMEAFMATGFSRFRINVTGANSFLRDGQGVSSMTSQLAKIDETLRKARKSWTYLGKPAGDLRLESEKDSSLKETTKCGCPSRYDLMLLGLAPAEPPPPPSLGSKCAAKGKAVWGGVQKGRRAVGSFFGRCHKRVRGVFIAGCVRTGRFINDCCAAACSFYRRARGAFYRRLCAVAGGIRHGIFSAITAVAKKWKWILGVLLTLALFYGVAVFSHIPFVEEWRTLYIETAMSTMNHQWLATKFIPESIINDVMEKARKQMDDNVVDSSTLPEPEPVIEEEPLSLQEAARLVFMERFPEVDIETMPEGIDYLNDIQMSDIVSMGVKTTAGDAIWAIDTVNNLLIVQVTGDGYVGKLAIIKDSGQVELAVNTRTSRGSTVTELCDESGAVLGINGNAFEDPNGRGSGVTPVGLIIHEGKQLHAPFGAYNYQTAGYDWNDNFVVGKNVNTSKLREALQFYPITVLDGEKHVDGSLGMGIQPRASIGQAKDGSTLMLIVDGRRVGYSLGITVSGCADILLRYNCQNAINLDGGSSASMSYMGQMITRTSSPQNGGRWLPSAWVVMPPA